MSTFDLFSSVRDGNTDIVRKLLQSKLCRARLNDRNEWGDTALHLAAEAGNGKHVKIGFCPDTDSRECTSRKVQYCCKGPLRMPKFKHTPVNVISNQWQLVVWGGISVGWDVLVCAERGRICQP